MEFKENKLITQLIFPLFYLSGSPIKSTFAVRIKPLSVFLTKIPGKIYHQGFCAQPQPFVRGKEKIGSIQPS
jgi:hypothetical protein